MNMIHEIKIDQSLVTITKSIAGGYVGTKQNGTRAQVYIKPDSMVMVDRNALTGQFQSRTVFNKIVSPGPRKGSAIERLVNWFAS